MSFNYKASLTINHAYVQSTDQTDFPILVSGTYAGSAGAPDLRTTGNGGKVQNANGYDIYFYSDSSLTTRIPAERESYNATTGAIIFWVKKTVTTASDTVIYIAYGDSGISTDPNSDGTYGATSTWDSNFKGVYHLVDGTTLSKTDSTSGGLGTGTGTPTATTGKIDGGAAFSGGDPQALSLGNASTHYSAVTFEAWVYPTSVATGSKTIISKGFQSVVNYTEWELRHSTVSGKVEFNCYTGGATHGVNTSTVTLSTSTWYHLVGTFDGTNAWKLYVNGDIDTSVTDSSTAQSTAVYGIGANFTQGFGTLEYFVGSMDEVRISNTNRSADWIKTEYNSQNSPSTFYTMGSETTVSTGTIRNHLPLIGVN